MTLVDEHPRVTLQTTDAVSPLAILLSILLFIGILVFPFSRRQ